MSGPSAKQGIHNIKPHMPVDANDNLPAVDIALNSNENALGPSPHAISAARGACTGLERYFEQPKKVLAPVIADCFDLDPDRITIGPGSDDLIARLARAYLEPGSELVRSANGYLKVPNYAHANNARPVDAADHDFTASVDAMLACVSPRTRMVYVANPDNPSGSYLPGAEMRRLHAGLPDHVVLVIDCAYAEYVDASDYEPAERLVEDAENVVMTRTFSKAFGLAGARVGWLYGPPGVVETLDRIGLTFPVASPSIAACVAALKDRAHLDYVIQTNRRARRELGRALEALGLKVYHSEANFLLVRFPDAEFSAAAAAAYVRENGIAIRRFAAPAYADCVRITLGPEPEIAAVTTALEAFLRRVH